MPSTRRIGKKHGQTTRKSPTVAGRKTRLKPKTPAPPAPADDGEAPEHRPDNKAHDSGSDGANTPDETHRDNTAANLTTAIQSLQQQMLQMADGLNNRMDVMEKCTNESRRSRSTTPRTRAKHHTPSTNDTGDTADMHHHNNATTSRHRSPSPFTSPRRGDARRDGSYRDNHYQDDRAYRHGTTPRHYTRASASLDVHDRRHYRRSTYEGPITLDARDDESTEAVNKLLEAAGSAITKKKGNAIFAPHRYVIRGNKNERIGMEEATWPEYFAALCRMTKDRKLTTAWTEHVADHMHQLATMACTWDWHTCRQWSETVFIMIADGRLPAAWSDRYAIKDVQRDICAVGTRLEKLKPATKTTKRTETSNAAATTNNYEPKAPGEYTKPEYNKEVDGKPCHDWNWGDCSFATSHGLQPDRHCHLCAWCAQTYKRANVHPEKACLNKKRYNDRTQKTSKQDF